MVTMMIDPSVIGESINCLNEYLYLTLSPVSQTYYSQNCTFYFLCGFVYLD